ncbi:MAG: SH3 domain-containing protein [Erythrobacter sp.]
MQSLRLIAWIVFAAVAALGIATADLSAQDRDTPYWASLRFDEVRMRVGPSREYPIDWVYLRKGLPVKVVRLREGWRLVEDHEGTRGWVASSQLDPTRFAMVQGEGPAPMREEPEPDAELRWRVEPGVVGELLRCEPDWCEIDVDGRAGWVARARLWGADEP